MSKARLGTIIGWVFVLMFFITCLYFGFLNAQTALTDPDTCWLVTLGNQILASGIPQSDPYSWTLAASSAISPSQYIAYQWLSAAVFATVFTQGGAIALVYLTALTICSSFIVVPLLAAKVLRLPLWPVALGGAASLTAGSFHFPCRPEIFSYLLLAILIASISKISRAKTTLPVYLYFLLGGCFFALWANLHTGFIIGLAALFVCTLTQQSKPLALTLLGALPATLLTPFGLALWQYLPHLFFSQANKFNAELLPLTAYELFSFDYLSFDLIIVATALAWLKQIRTWTNVTTATDGFAEKFSKISLQKYTWLILTTTALITALQCRRLVPFACLMAMGTLYQFLQRKLESPESESFFQKVENVAQALMRRSKNLVILLPLALTALGVSNASSIFPPALPQDTYALFEPKAALQLISVHRPKGRVLNDPQFGDLMLLNFKERAQVFIDTRFDVYGDRLALDYWQMANARGKWLELLRQYQIDWVFFPPRAPLVHRLLQNPDWQLIYQDDKSVILEKRVKP